MNVTNHSELVWKVARYTSAAPIFFEELDNYVDGGVLANNPASAGLTFIQEMYSKKKTKIPISILVSLGSGIMPTDELDKENSRDFIFFGHIKKMYDKASGLITLLGNAVSFLSSKKGIVLSILLVQFLFPDHRIRASGH